MTTLFFLHGFLGSPQDWCDCLVHLTQYNCIPLSYPFDVPKTESLAKEESVVVVGYSMGGRIAARHPYPRILISAHPGLVTEQERKNRLASDARWIDRLRSVPFKQWLLEWYGQPLFDSLRTHPRFQEVLQRRSQLNPDEMAHILSTETLAHDRHSVDPSNTVFIYGKLDTKFETLYRGRQAIGIENVGHACILEDPLRCAEAIKRALILIPNHSNNLMTSFYNDP